MKKRYNNREIMNTAHEIRKTEGLTMGEALKKAWAEAKAESGVSEHDKKVQEYFRRLKALNEAQEAFDEIKGELQDACLQSPDFCISGFGWNASFKEVTANRLDSKALKADYADLYATYCKPQTTRRFLCKPVAVSA